MSINSINLFFKQHSFIELTGRKRALLLICSIALSGCESLTRKEYSQPSIELPSAWSHAPISGEQVLESNQWWRAFQDKTLNHLIEQVLIRNNDMAKAALKIRVARLKAGIKDRNQISVDDLKVTVNNKNTYDTSFGLDYKLDLWGKFSSERDKARWEAMATEQDRAYTALSLIGTTAILYWDIALLNESIAVEQASLDYQEKTFEIAQAKYLSGAVSKMQMLQIKEELVQARITLSQSQQNKVKKQHALAILFDQSPENVVSDPQTLPAVHTAIPDSTPSTLLARRPDMQARELRLRSAFANTNIARTAFYPDFSLSGSIKAGGERLTDILSNPIGTFASTFTLPFEWRKTQLKIKISEATYEQEVIEFKKALYKALSEVENKLSDRTHLMIKERELSELLSLAYEAEHLKELRYQAGADDVTSWLKQQEVRRKAQLNLIQNRHNQLKNMMTLYQALGGGFDSSQKLPEKQSS
ncbi:efflux transporter outer membrane subunit [Vibrio sp. S4M6]|uniref:TolC family protein n=1 Tax=Vibrio sinus TaxID=2946865 RepID=UPI002029F0D5|nr:efflux transporter outer membrane subunit [Vibrio sinus]MCL9782798.1 efflux transporter outer membrane subunit [Vibrio sinus]